MLKWLIAGVAVVLVLAQSTNANEEGAACVVQSGGAGTCRLLQDCPSQETLLRSNQQFRPDICSFAGDKAIVCCPEVSRSTVGEKANRACQSSAAVGERLLIPLISGGVETQPAEFPHMALLGYIAQGGTELTWNCGGTLISHNFVVTAAHCFTERTLRAPVKVRLGEYSLEDDDDVAEDYGIKSYVLHPEYKLPSWYNDIALIELDRHVHFTRYVRPACLWTQPEDPMTGLMISGWGSTSYDGIDDTMSKILLKGNGTLNRVAPDVCGTYYRTESRKLGRGIANTMMCAMDPKGAVDTCTGDSGGPIQVYRNGTKKSFYVVGVTSVGSQLCGGRTPAIYTRLYSYLEWIEEKVWPNK